jgi:Domain of unknown function (DUF4258)
MATPEADRPVIEFTAHARQRMQERGAGEAEVLEAIHTGQREPAQRGLTLFRLNLEFHKEWAGRYYGLQQVVPIVAEEPGRLIVVTVYVFYF